MERLPVTALFLLSSRTVDRSILRHQSPLPVLVRAWILQLAIWWLRRVRVARSIWVLTVEP